MEQQTHSAGWRLSGATRQSRRRPTPHRCRPRPRLCSLHNNNKSARRRYRRNAPRRSAGIGLLLVGIAAPFKFAVSIHFLPRFCIHFQKQILLNGPIQGGLFWECPNVYLIIHQNYHPSKAIVQFTIRQIFVFLWKSKASEHLRHFYEFYSYFCHNCECVSRLSVLQLVLLFFTLNLSESIFFPGPPTPTLPSSPKNKTWKGRMAKQLRRMHGGAAAAAAPATGWLGAPLERCPADPDHPLVPKAVSLPAQAVEVSV